MRERSSDVELVGVDPTREMVEQARRNGRIAPARRRQRGHLAHNDVVPLLGGPTGELHEVGRMLRPGGRFVLAAAVVTGITRVALGFYRPGRSHTPTELTRLFERAGLDVTDWLWVSDLHSMGKDVAVTVE